MFIRYDTSFEEFIREYSQYYLMRLEAYRDKDPNSKMQVLQFLSSAFPMATTFRMLIDLYVTEEEAIKCQEENFIKIAEYATYNLELYITCLKRAIEDLAYEDAVAEELINNYYADVF